MHKKIIALLCMTALAAGFQISCEKRSGPVGTKTNPIRFYFMPLKGQEVFEKNAPVLKKFLEERTGFTVETVNSPDFITIIKAFGNNQADIAFINTLGYLMARDWAKADAPLVSIYGDVYKTYRGEILARVGGNISSAMDLNGKAIVFADPFSASGYLYVMKYLDDYGIKPQKIIFAHGHKEAVEMLYKGEVDAAATYHSRPASDGAERDARSELLSAYPDVFAKLKIVAVTDEIPNGPVATSNKLPAEAKEKLVAALMEFSQTIEGRKALGDLYNITGFAPASPSDYDGLQAVIKKLGKSIEEVVPGGVTFYKKQINPLLE